MKNLNKKAVIEFDQADVDTSGEVFYKIKGFAGWWLPERVVEALPWAHERVLGYPIRELYKFAYVCRQQGVTDEQLLDFVTATENAVKVAFKSQQEAFEKCLRDITKKLEVPGE